MKTLTRKHTTIDPNSGGNSRPSQAETDAMHARLAAKALAKRQEEARDEEAARISWEMSNERAIVKARLAIGTPEQAWSDEPFTPTPLYRKHLREARAAIEAACQMNPDHGIWMLLCEVTALCNAAQ